MSKREDNFKIFNELFLEYLEQEANNLNVEFENVSCRAYSHFPLNEDPAGIGYFTMFLDCILNGAADYHADNVALGIAAYDNDGRLTVNADVSWGEPSFKMEDSIFEDPVEVTEETLAVVRERMPTLVANLREAIRENPHGMSGE